MIFRFDAAHRIKGIGVTIGVEVAADHPRTLKSRVASLRTRYPFLMVHGKTEELIRAACEDANVDVLLHPCSHDLKRTLGIATARAAQHNQVAIGFDLRPLLLLRGMARARWMEAARRNLQVARKFELPLVITGGARSHLDIRAPRDLMAMARLVGFETGEALDALKLPARLAELNKRKWAGPGVELL